MQREDFTLNNINNNISECLKNNDLNFCKMLVQAYEEDLSVTAKYAPPETWVSLGKTPSKSEKEFYYGVSPLLDGPELIRIISKLDLLTPDALDKYIDSHGEWFMAHAEQKEILPALSRYIVVVMASHFGIQIKTDGGKYVEFLKFLTENCGYPHEAIKTMMSYDEKTEILTVYGCPTVEILEYLDKFSYSEAEVINKNHSLGKVEKIHAWLMAEKSPSNTETKDIREIYSNYTKLVKGRVFYSGVLVKPTFFEIVDRPNENNKIQSVCIHFERSSYGTVCALDNNLTEHPLLQKVKSEIVQMLQKDDAEKIKLQEQIASIESNSSLSDSDVSKNLITAVNQYLSACTNVNQIGISANIITSDNLMLLGQRSSGNIDEGKLYPGVNGNAEVADGNVSFYSTSVYEDYPTIHLNNDRIDFFGEIGRETYGELKLDLSKQEWICYGIAISGNIPSEQPESVEYRENFRRLHFNLIFEHTTEKSFQELTKLSLKAAEAFETKRFLGIDAKCEVNRRTYIIKTVKNSIVSVVNQKDFIEAVIALIIFLPRAARVISASSSLGTLYSSIFEQGWTEIVAIFLALAIVIITIFRISRAVFRYSRKRKNARSIRVYKEMSYENVNNQVEKALLKPKKLQKNANDRLYSLHPAAYACLRAYVDNLVYDTFFPKDRR